jgi:hypothetical protein
MTVCIIAEEDVTRAAGKPVRVFPKRECKQAMFKDDPDLSQYHLTWRIVRT